MDQSLVGKWKRFSQGYDFYFNFKSDGTFDTDELPGKDVTKGTYKIMGDTIMLTVPSYPGSSNVDVAMFKYSVSGRKLTIYLPGGGQNNYDKA